MVDFVLVGALVIAVCVALLQLALGLHVRNVLTDAAGEGARRAEQPQHCLLYTSPSPRDS